VVEPGEPPGELVSRPLEWYADLSPGLDAPVGTSQARPRGSLDLATHLAEHSCVVPD